MTAVTFSRRDTSTLGRWWWTIDRWSLSAILFVIAIGVLMSFAASPPVAERLNLGTFFFVKRHLMMIPFALLIIVSISLCNPIQIRRIATLGFILGVLLLVYTIFGGVEVKGGRRWIMIAGISLQASEFVKPAFTVLTAWMLAEKYRDPSFPGITISMGLLGVVVGLLMLQPDLGMTFVIVVTWAAQLFVAGLPFIWIAIAGSIGIVGLCLAYFLFPHVTKRIDQFLNPGTLDTKNELYQITQSLEAFRNGGIFGKGPGEGIVKKFVPDAHADFVFSVAGEEFGLLACLFIVGLFAFIVLRSLLRTMQDQSLFIIAATFGIAIQFGLQAFINMSSALHLIPTKGMTMPFISYGGSSLLALAFAVGMLLSLTRKRHGWMEAL